MAKPAETLRLIHELLDGSIAPEDFTRLHQILLTEPEARKDYYDLLCTDQMLADAYEMPAHVEEDARAMQEPAARGYGVKWLAVAAAVALLAVLVTWGIRGNAPRVTVTPAADTHFLMDGQRATAGMWKRGQDLEVKEGMVVAGLTEAAEACIEGSAHVRLASNDGDLKLFRGSAFFRVSPESPDFVVEAGGATVRHEGTDFGIRATDGNSCEVHVLSGTVEISRPGLETLVLSAGEAASWENGGPTQRTAASPAIRRSPPQEHLVFDDDFSEPEGTPLNEKMPDAGQPWRVFEEQTPSLSGGGRLDTSGGFRHLGAPFAALPEAGSPGHRVLVFSLATSEPAALEDKGFRRSGIERISLMDGEGTRVCSLVAHGREDHRWRIRDDVTGNESGLTRLSALEANQMTLRFDPSTGRATLHEGPTAQGETIAELSVGPRAMPVTAELWNDYGGDFAVSRLTARIIEYP